MAQGIGAQRIGPLRPRIRTVALAAVLAVTAVLSGCAASKARPVPQAAPPIPVTAAPTTAAPATTTTTAAPPVSIVAHAIVPTLEAFAQPGDAAPAFRLPNPRELGGPLVLLTTQERPGWIRALLPVRPNGTQAWVRAADVKLDQHQFRITVALGAHRLTVWNGFNKVADEPIGVGTGATPTPGGLFYTEDFVKLDDPSGPYGAYAYGLSGFSEVLTSFGGGPGQLAIHGTDEPGRLGSDVSHGCIRMSNEAITRLANILPLGVPVQVVA